MDTTKLASKVKVKEIDAKCAEWVLYHHAWDLMNYLYIGGVEIEAVAEQFLKKRAKELPDVYQSRIERFSYQNHAGACVDYYLSALFETPPTIEVASDDDPTQIQNNARKEAKDRATRAAQAQTPPAAGAAPKAPPTTPIPDPPPQAIQPSELDSFYDDFEYDCDKGGTHIIEHLREYLKNLIVFGRAITLVDRSVPDEVYNTLAEQKASGSLDPHLVSWDPRQLINYQYDDNGKLLWVMFHCRKVFSASVFEKPVDSDNWYYFDRQNWAHYQRIREETDNDFIPDSAEAELKDSGEHTMAKAECVPVIFKILPKGAWLFNRAYSPAKDHLNTDNVLGFALYMAALAMPVIKTDGDFVVSLSEAGFIKIGKDDEYSWAEPEGKSFGHLATRCISLVEEIFRSFYLISQARSNSATPAAQSGVSKQEDMMPSKKILNTFGSIIRSTIQNLYDYVAAARGDDVTWDVRGLEFPEGPPDEEIDLVVAAQAVGVPSTTYEKELYKKSVRSTMRGANKLLMDKITAEIDAAPSQQDRDIQELQQRAASLVSKSAFPGTSI